MCMQSAAALLGLSLAVAQPQHVAWTLDAQPNPARPAARRSSASPRRSNPAGTSTRDVHAGRHSDHFQIAPNRHRRKVRTFQPPPKKAFDANFNSETETYEGDAVFLLEAAAARRTRPPATRQLTLAGRYQTCNSAECVPAKWTGAVRARRSIPPPPAAAPAIPPDFRKSSRAPRIAPPMLHRAEGWPGFLARRLRLRPRLHLHALRLPDDPDHDVLLPEPAVRRTARW